MKGNPTLNNPMFGSSTLTKRASVFFQTSSDGSAEAHSPVQAYWMRIRLWHGRSILSGAECPPQCCRHVVLLFRHGAACKASRLEWLMVFPSVRGPTGKILLAEKLLSNGLQEQWRISAVKRGDNSALCAGCCLMPENRCQTMEEHACLIATLF